MPQFPFITAPQTPTVATRDANTQLLCKALNRVRAARTNNINEKGHPRAFGSRDRTRFFHQTPFDPKRPTAQKKSKKSKPNPGKCEQTCFEISPVYIRLTERHLQQK